MFDFQSETAETFMILFSLKYDQGHNSSLYLDNAASKGQWNVQVQKYPYSASNFVNLSHFTEICPDIRVFGNVYSLKLGYVSKLYILNSLKNFFSAPPTFRVTLTVKEPILDDLPKWANGHSRAMVGLKQIPYEWDSVFLHHIFSYTIFFVRCLNHYN